MHAAVDNLPELTGDEKAIESSRWFKAPRWMVWEAFADPKQVVRTNAAYSAMSDDSRKNYETQVVGFFLQSLPPSGTAAKN